MLTRRLLALGAGCALLTASGALAQEVIWDSPPNNDLPAFLDQQFSPANAAFSTYLVAHIRLDNDYFIHDIRTYYTFAAGAWPIGEIEATLNIIPQDGDLPPNSYNPAGPQENGDGTKVLANLALNGNRLSLTTSLDGGVVLEAGNYWVGLTPKISFVDFGREFHKGTDNWLKNSAGRNPGGGIGVGTDWFDAGQTFAGIDWGMAITVTGENVPADCPWDIDNDGTVGATDLLSLLVTWGPCACNDCPADFDGNCFVGATDLLALLVNWGACP